MKTVLLCALLLAAPAFAQGWDDDAPPPQPPEDYVGQEYAPPDQGPTLEDFESDSELAWNGEWIDTPDYGRVWQPTRVSDDWQPYAYGRWTWTDAGWAWVSDEPFGWAVYHYGRWAYSPTGWLWVPGRVWAPAWVAWEWRDGYAGWCPLGPRHAVYQQPQLWVYVNERRFLEPVRYNVIPRRQRPRPEAMGASAPPPRVVEQATGRSIHPVAIADAPAPHAASFGSGTVTFYRPRTAPVPQAFSGGPRTGQPHAVTPQAGNRPQPANQTQGNHAQAGTQQQRPQGGPRPIYFGGVPAPRQGGTPRPQAAGRNRSEGEQKGPHAQER